jgi:hypothetical protein
MVFVLASYTLAGTRRKFSFYGGATRGIRLFLAFISITCNGFKAVRELVDKMEIQS